MFRCLGLALMVTCALHAQNSPEFDAASIKPFSGGGRGSRLTFTPGRVVSTGAMFEAAGVTARQIILAAYGLKEYQLTGGPAWMNTDLYSLQAAAANPSASESELRLMLQNFLAQRFHLVLHTDTRDIAVYALKVGKNGPKLPGAGKSEDDHPSLDRFIADARAAGGPTMVTRETMQMFVDSMNRLNASFIDRPVLDQTGLTGTYLFALHVAPEQDYKSAVEDAFGLRFEPQKAAIDVRVIAHIEKPTGN